jgi:hypothetical protein
MCMCVSVCTHVSMYRRVSRAAPVMRARMFVCKRMCVSAYMHTHKHAYTHTYAWSHTHTHTHTHTKAHGHTLCTHGHIHISFSHAMNGQTDRHDISCKPSVQRFITGFALASDYGRSRCSYVRTGLENKPRAHLRDTMRMQCAKTTKCLFVLIA